MYKTLLKRQESTAATSKHNLTILKNSDDPLSSLETIKDFLKKPTSLRPKQGRFWEYWNTYLFEFPAYIYLALCCMRRKIVPTHLVKANWGLDHGGLGFASKHSIHKRFNQSYFLPSILLTPNTTPQEKEDQLLKFTNSLNPSFPIILKPDSGRIGRGVFRVRSKEEIRKAVEDLSGSYLAEQYCSLPLEFGVFYYRLAGKAALFSITWKEFPEVVGDGQHSVKQLINMTPRLRRFYRQFSGDIPLSYIPAPHEIVRLSYVGNHAQGAVFHDVNHLACASLLTAIEDVIQPCKGFHFGRLDLKSSSIDDLLNGRFKVIEVNGIDSLSINMFDPNYSLLNAYRILLTQYRLLVEVASEHRKQQMTIFPLRKLMGSLWASEQTLLAQHNTCLQNQLR